MIDSFFIKNFKNIKLLELPDLKRINLFTGKNNTGKSTLLEALTLYVNDGDMSVIAQLLKERGEIIEPRGPNHKTHFRKGDIDVLASLFTDRKIGYDVLNDSIVLSQIKVNLFTEVENTQDELRIGFVRYIDEHFRTKDGDEVIKKRFLSNDEDTIVNDDINLGIQIIAKGESNILRIGKSDLHRRLSNRYGVSRPLETQSFQFIKSGLTSVEDSAYLWDQVTLTEKEKFVIEALQIIEPNIQRIAFVRESSRDRMVVVKVKDNEKVVSLKGMGDGINRILNIILAAVNCSNGYLLIDEFENGLHHSVQEQLWRILIHLSTSLNLQIFATTHSNDCIDGFENAIGSSGDRSIGRLFRLEKDKNDSINIVPFNIDEVKIATEEHIEIR